MDLTSLRIDHAERMTLQLGSLLISPTRYMTAFLQQRGWRMPAQRCFSEALELQLPTVHIA